MASNLASVRLIALSMLTNLVPELGAMLYERQDAGESLLIRDMLSYRERQKTSTCHFRWE